LDGVVLRFWGGRRILAYETRRKVIVARKYLGPPGGKRRRRLLLLLPMAAIAALVFGLTAASATIDSNSGFEGDDGNLLAATATDWNSFAPVNYLPSPSTTPTRTADKTVSGFVFKGLEDWQATTSDNGFAGGTKQDKDCASVIGTKAPNKDDLKRIYIAHNVGSDGHLYLELAWVRIPQNTTSASAHVGFEFNQGSTPCLSGSNPGGLVKRTAGDMLIVYDFAGSTSSPILTVRRWITSGACEISSDTAPCWGPAADLTSSGFAVAKVNVGSTASDALTPPALTSTTGASTTSTLGDSEFGEATIDLTGAQIFNNNVCTSFGQAEGVSRSSGNSGQAAMEDLVGPGHVSITNCGTLIVKKVTDPSPDPTGSSFGFKVDGPNPPNSGGTSGSTSLPSTFSIKNGESNTSTVFGGLTYSAEETSLPTGWTFTTASCDNGSGTLTGQKIAGITVATGETVTCEFDNKLQQGAIKISKTNGKTGNPLAGATFTIKSGGTPLSGSPFTTNSSGEICVDHLNFGDYSVQETGAPTGYAIDDSTARTVTVNNNASCSDATYVGETTSFSDTPTSDIQVRFRDGGSGTTSATISCDNATGTTSTANTTGWDDTTTVTGIKAPTTVKCTITIDP
jgi:hypothetical protein